MHSARWRTLVFATLLALAGTVLLPATAATAALTQDAAVGNYCVVNALSAEDPPNAVSSVRCFTTSRAADAYWHSPEFTDQFTDQVTPLDVEGSGPFMVAELYENANYNLSGNVLVVIGPHPCTTTYSDLDYYLGDLRLDGQSGYGFWNDRITSYKTFNYCDVRFYEHIGFRGGAFPGPSSWSDHSQNLGWYGWNDRASSIKFS